MHGLCLSSDVAVCLFVSNLHREQIVILSDTNLHNDTISHDMVEIGWNFMITCTLITFIAVVLYGCETWSLALKKECRLRIFENRVLRQISQGK